MNERILALDMGGTSVKAALYNDVPYRNSLLKETSWVHRYKDCGLEKAKADLIDRIKGFCDCKIDAVGIGVAGLVATDNSLYRSTVLTSFIGFNLPDFLKQELKAEVVAIDNDADCGAMGLLPKRQSRDGILYVVVGSGIGSAYVRNDGRIPYLRRFSPDHIFSDNDNPIPNDIGLQVAVPKLCIYQRFARYNIKIKDLDRILLDENGNPLTGPNGDINSIRVGVLGSATSFKKIAEGLLSGKSLEEHYRYLIESEGLFKMYTKQDKFNLDLKDLKSEQNFGIKLSIFANYGDKLAKEVFEIFGHFLGYGIAEAQKIIKSEQKLRGFPDVYLSGQIVNSFGWFNRSISQALTERSIDCALEPEQFNSNVRGAYFQASRALDKQKPQRWLIKH